MMVVMRLLILKMVRMLWIGRAEVLLAMLAGDDARSWLVLVWELIEAERGRISFKATCKMRSIQLLRYIRLRGQRQLRSHDASSRCRR
jgi:hypothetical protein